jgi:hypothetical protein
MEMTVSRQTQRQAQFVSNPNRRLARRRRQAKAQAAPGSLFASSLKASLVGGFGILLLMLISLIPFQFLAFLVVPGFLVVWLTTGIMAGIFAGENVKSSYQGGKVGWMAGFWAGVYGGIIAMILAAIGISVLGIPIVNFGQGVVSQFSPEQLAGWGSYGFTATTIALTGRVFGMFIMVGVIGSLISGLFSSIGGMIYPKISS